MSSAVGVLYSATIESGTSSNVSYQKKRSKSFRESRRISTIRLKPLSESLQQCQMRLRSSMQDRKLSTATSPITDRITMPPRKLFISMEEYSATLLHELTHYADFRIMPRIFAWTFF